MLDTKWSKVKQQSVNDRAGSVTISFNEYSRLARFGGSIPADGIPGRMLDTREPYTTKTLDNLVYIYIYIYIYICNTVERVEPWNWLRLKVSCSSQSSGN